MACNLFLKNIEKSDVRRALIRFGKNKNTKIFTDSFIKNLEDIPKLARYTITELDSKDEVQSSILSFFEVFDVAKAEVLLKSPELEAAFNDLQNYLYSTLHIALDEALSGAMPEKEIFIEAKSEKEVRDIHLRGLEEHMIDIYGTESHDLRTSLLENFKVDIISAAYRDKISGNLIIKDNVILNQNFQKLKNKYYKTIVEYLQSVNPSKYVNSDVILNYVKKNNPKKYTLLQELKEKDPKTYKNNLDLLIEDCLKDLDTSKLKILKTSMTDSNYNFIGTEYYNTLKSFYRYILKLKSLEIFNGEITQNNRNKIKQSEQSEKSDLYKNLIQELRKQSSQFDEKLNNIYKTKKLQNALNQLYIANNYSPYYSTIKNLINDFNLGKTEVLGQTVNQIIENIESENVDLLLATKAYTYLTHFDSLLLATQGKSFSIKEGLENVEFADMSKYSHHIDTAHEKKGWQASEAIDSEKYIANLAKNILSLVDVFSYKTDVYQNKKVDTTSFIMASRNLINDILLGNISFSGVSNSDSRRKVYEDFKQQFIKFHDNPTRRFQKILEYLFDTLNGNRKEIYKEISNNRILTDFDLDILYSIYHTIFNENNPSSLLSKEIAKMQSANGIVSHLVDEFSGMVDRNVNIDYLETGYDYSTNTVTIRMKRKYYNNLEVIKTIKEINRIANMRDNTENSKKLQDKYNFTLTEAIDGFDHYSVDLGISKINLKVPSSAMAKILYNIDGIKFDSEPFDMVDKVDLISFRDKVLSKNISTLNNNEKLLYNMLLFIEDFLGINMISNASLNLQVLQEFKSIYNPKDSKYNINGINIQGKLFLMPLMLLAMRSAYANYHYSNIEPGLTLKEHLIAIKDKVYLNAFNSLSKVFSYRFNNAKYRIASNLDTVLEMWADAYSMLSGKASKSTTKDHENNNIPNNSVNKLGSMVHYYLDKQLDKMNNSNVDSLFFVLNRSTIKNIFHDLEVTTKKDRKNIKQFSAGELFYHSIFNKFWRNYLDTGNVIIQPTIYSDKTTFINYEINTKFIGKDKEDLLKYKGYKNYILSQYDETIGDMYQRIWETTKEKLMNITNLYKLEHTELNDLNYKLVMKRMSPEVLKRYSKIYQVVLNHITKNNIENASIIDVYLELKNTLDELTLNNLISKTSGNLELDKDFRKIKVNGKTVTTYNEELEYFSELFTNKSDLNDYLEKQKTIFVSSLLDTNSYFLVLHYKDKYEYYLLEKLPEQASSKNTIIDTILSQYKKLDRVEFFKNWVDKKTGRLILAKQNGNNILESGDMFNDNLNVTLNPILDKYFYVEGFLSNNMRLSLTGSEINHPNKASNTLYDLVKSAKDNESLKVVLKNLKIKKSINLAQLLNYIKNTDVVLDIHDLLVDASISDEYKTILKSIYEQTLLQITNVSQGTQFKRNVIIPATLQHCQQNVINGIASKTKCAVIYDEPADVWNYRGDHEKAIDSADGAAWINPFLSILENKSLGSQAVGFIKKPIWHSYDVENGTAFLAKFATDTITNEVMSLSINSHTNMFNLFKKMTNIQWQGDVDLMLVIGFDELDTLEDRERWFNTAILGNSIYFDGKGVLTYTNSNKLLYKNQYGEIINISSFGKAKTEVGNIYYTLEASNNLDVSGSKVYHVFYDNTLENGTIEKSRHITFDTYQKAVKFIKAHPGAHTINSLFELHTALGGINNVNFKGGSSEFVNEVVVNFMNSVGELKPGFSKNGIIDLTSYSLPLKNYHIGYALNNTAVKNGAKNVNNKEAWYDNSDLNYFEVDSDGLGMQMNADHDIVNSELTEFSQVITATSAYGYTQEYTNEIFLGLAHTALEASKDVINAVNKFIESLDNSSEAKSDLYDAIGRIIFINKSIKDKESLLGIIMDAVNKIFYKRNDHTNDNYKIPFSDANVYSDFISTLASTITKLSIKRKHPGSGCVMAPGYNIIQYFEVDGYKLNSAEVLKQALEDYKQELINLLKTSPNFDLKTNSIVVNKEQYFLNKITIKSAEELTTKLKLFENNSYINDYSDVTDINKFFITNYLNKKQGEVKVSEDNSWYMPSDIVDIIDNEGKVHTYDLDSMDKYYRFKDGIYDAEINYNVLITTEYLKGKFKIALNEDPNSMFVLEREKDINNQPTGKYTIHFKTGGFDINTKRRTIGNLTKEQKARLFNAALDILPKHSKIRLSPSTAEEIKSKLGGLTKGSYVGYTSMFTDDTRHINTEIIQIGEPYPVTYTDINGVQWTEDVNEYEKISTKTYGHKYRVNIVKPHNLRPALIRWQYKELSSDGNSAEEITDNIKYMNIFDTKPIRDAFINPESRSATYRNDIQETLNHLEDGGYFLNENNEQIHIVEGSLENTLAELVMSNLHKDTFGIGDESLNEILKLGRDYFIPNTNNKLNAPNNIVYDVAFLKDDGHHTLISLGTVTTNEYVYDESFKVSQLTTNKDDEIYYTKNNRKLFKIGKWINCSDTVIYDNNVFIDLKTGKAVENLDNYRLKDSEDATSVLKRVDYVKRYSLVDKFKSKSGKINYKNNVLYAISDLNVFEEALGDKKSALNLRRKILSDIYETDNYKLAYINTNKIYRPHKFDHIKKSLSWITGNYNTPLNVKDIILAQLDDFETNVDKRKKALSKEDWEKLGEINSNNTKRYEELLQKFIEQEADKKWASFLDSLLYISSRIPAQTLQSFMSMRLVGWTGNSKNMAYVSHFLTYLQGSDYDIDKAYIMSLSYDSNGVYIGWSNLFDCSSYLTLEMSKKLPIPKGTKITLNTNEGASVDSEMQKLLNIIDNTDEASRVAKLKYYGIILKKVEANGFKIKTSEISNKYDKILDILNKHEMYVIPAGIAEAAYKNVASANIYAVADSIKNRDQAYTAISMDILKKAAEKSPKGNLAMNLNMLNPLTKYIMLYLNLVGKNVISIAANGEKLWFNAFYYWTLVLKNGSDKDIQRLKFSQTLSRILGRAKFVDSLKDPTKPKTLISPKTVTYLPDLNIYDLEIKSKLMELFADESDVITYKEVDLLISQLLSAATDNAKELILAKINAGTNFARMYLYAMMTGFNIDDIVAFMTSPVAEFIDQMSASNIFQDNDTNNYAMSAINLAQGIVSINLLHGKINIKVPDNEVGGYVNKEYNKRSYLLAGINEFNSTLLNNMKETLNMSPEESFEDLQTAMLGLILYAVKSDSDIDVPKLFEEFSDFEINNYLNYCQSIIRKLKEVKKSSQYSSYLDFIDDSKEFKKLYNLATEISTISSAWLGLNLGLPTDELSLLLRLVKMSKIVSNRESVLEINVSNLYEDSYKDSYKLLKSLEIINNRNKLLNRLRENNETLNERSDEEILNILDEAYKAQIINNFDIVKYLKDMNYRKTVIDYYEIIMGTLNVFDMMEKIPHYTAILECLKSLVIANDSLSYKSRLISKLLNIDNMSKVTDLLLRGAIRYVDSKNIFDYFLTLPSIPMKSTIMGFDPYFNNINTNNISLNTLNGVATLKHWVENEFWDMLKEQYKNPSSQLYQNEFIKHLKVVASDTLEQSLATDINLLDPNVTTTSRLAYDEILRGMAELAKIAYIDIKNGPKYSIADIFLLYNLAVYLNKYGSERFTTIFKIINNSDSLINQYLKYIGDRDYNDAELEYDYYDYLINSAPVIDEISENFHTEPFVKVKDPVEGFKLKLYNKRNNSYEAKEIVLSYMNYEKFEDRIKRIQNYSENCPLELINTHKLNFKSNVLTFDGLFNNMSKSEQISLKSNMLNLIKDYSLANKILLFKNCY